jgi:hypothetical protein
MAIIPNKATLGAEPHKTTGILHNGTYRWVRESRPCIEKLEVAAILPRKRKREDAKREHTGIPGTGNGFHRKRSSAEFTSFIPFSGDNQTYPGQVVPAITSLGHWFPTRITRSRVKKIPGSGDATGYFRRLKS